MRRSNRCSKALAERYPQNTAFRKQLVNLYMFQHQPDEAEKELRAIAAADPKDTQSGLDLIQFLYTVKAAAAARQELVTRINAGGDIFPISWPWPSSISIKATRR